MILPYLLRCERLAVCLYSGAIRVLHPWPRLGQAAANLCDAKLRYYLAVIFHVKYHGQVLYVDSEHVTRGVSAKSLPVWYTPAERESGR